MQFISKKVVAVLAGLVFCLSAGSVFAGLEITEIMYDLEGSDTKREWVEVYNPDSVSIEVTGDWRFSDGSPHLMNDKAVFSVSPKSFFILVSDKDSFLSDHAGFAGTLIDTSMSLNNTSGILKILDANDIEVSSVEYSSVQGGSGDANSLQKISGVWKSATPTPGEANVKEETPAPAPDPDPKPEPAPAPSSGGGTGNSEKIEIKKLETNILAKSVVFAGIPAEFKAETVGVSNERLLYGKYFWNFGDGDSRQAKTSDITKFTHTFAYEGEYSVSLEYYESYYSETPNATDKMIVKVIKPNILISSVGDEKDFFIEVSNDTSYEADLFGWILIAGQKSFLFPKNTFIQSKKKMILSPKITGFSITDKDSLKLLSSYGTLVFDYGASIKKVTIIEPEPEPVQTIAQTKSVNTNTINPPETPAVKDPIVNQDSQTESDINIESNFSAQVIGTGASVPRGVLDIRYMIVLFAFLLLSGGAVYFVRTHYRKPVLEKAGGDFEILE